MYYKTLRIVCCLVAFQISSLAFVERAVGDVVNGDFELPNTGGVGQAFSPGQNIGGWTTLGNPGTIVYLIDSSASEPGNGIQSFNAHSGSQSIDLTGLYNQGPSLGISQSINTTMGAFYKLSFWVGTPTPTFGPNVDSFYHDAASIDLSINGGVRQKFTNNTRINGVVSWEEFVVTFMATSNSTELAFFNGTSPINGNTAETGIGNNGSNYVALDDVSVVAVPEPASCAAVAVIGGFALRRFGRRVKGANG